jgi:20S proteasome alpha/beta subunit
VNLGAAAEAMAMARFDPYENNGGTCVAVAGDGYCVVAADTRLSVGYSILTRDHSKICQLYVSETFRLASSYVSV